MKQYRVLIDANDEKGLVYKVSKLFFEHGFNILNNREFVDKENAKFFMRSVIDGDVGKDTLIANLKDILPAHANVRVVEPQKKNVVLMVTKESHCLGDILIRYHAGELDANIVAVVSNYKILEPLVKKFDIPYYHVDATDLEREDHEGKVLEVLAKFDIDYIVLAKYMRILTPKFVSVYENKILNIHHSFLPAFIGANPYKQAYERGVKIIGATAHFVNNHLDEGPIIAQDVSSVDHTFTWKDMQQAGRDTEKVVLAKALKIALDDRVFVHENKTVVF